MSNEPTGPIAPASGAAKPAYSIEVHLGVDMSIVVQRVDPDGTRSLRFQSCPIAEVDRELEIDGASILHDGEVVVAVYSLVGEDSSRLAIVDLSKDNAASLSLSTSRFDRSTPVSSAGSWFYLVERRAHEVRPVRVFLSADKGLTVEPLDLDRGWTRGQLFLGVDDASETVQVVSRNVDRSAAFLFSDDEGSVSPFFRISSTADARLFLPYVIDENRESVLVHASGTPSQSARVIRFSWDGSEWVAGDEESDVLAVQPGARIVLVLTRCPVGYQVFGLRRTPAASGHRTNTLTLSNTVDEPQLRRVGTHADRFAIETPERSNVVCLFGQRLRFECVDMSPATVPRRAESEQTFDVAHVPGLRCTVEVLAQGHLRSARFAHVTGYSAYGQSQRLRDAPPEISDILQRGALAYCNVVFSGTLAGQAGGPEAVLLKQRMFGTALETISDLLGLSTSTISIEGRSAGALLVAPALSSHPSLVRAALFVRPLLDPIGQFETDLERGSAAHVAEWGDPRAQGDRRLMERYSPLNLISAGIRASVVLAADPDDTRISYDGVRKYHQQLEAAGVSVQMMRTGGGHLARGSTEERRRELVAQYDKIDAIMGWSAK